jgi:8-oxo-dGTP diphosphatase
MSENILAVFNNENVSEDESKNYRQRRSVRIVVFDSDNKIALLFVKYPNKPGYYTLPGGGFEKEETFEQAAVRECKEEIACDIEIKQVLGTVIEYWQKETLRIQSYGFVGEAFGNKGLVEHVGDEDEGEKNTQIFWVTLHEAIEIMENENQRDNLYFQYKRDLDLTYLRTANEK